MFHTDDAMFMSKAVARLPRKYKLEVLGLWLICGQWCAHEATDGYITLAQVHQLSPLESTKSTNHRIGLMVDVLGKVSRVTWHDQPALLFHDWDVWQDTAEAVKARKDGWRERQRRSRQARKQGENRSRIVRESVENLSRKDRENEHPKRSDQDVGENVTRDVTPMSRHPYSLLPTDTYNSPKQLAHVSDAPARNGSAELAGKIVAKYLGQEYASAVKTSMRLQVGELLCAGHDSLDVEAAVELWTQRPGTSPKILPHLLSDVTRARNPSRLPAGFGAGTATAKAQGHQDAAENLIARRRAAENTTNNARELEP